MAVLVAIAFGTMISQRTSSDLGMVWAFALYTVLTNRCRTANEKTVDMALAFIIALLNVICFLYGPIN